jgi:hypothetical protein
VPLAAPLSELPALARFVEELGYMGGVEQDSNGEAGLRRLLEAFAPARAVG